MQLTVKEISDAIKADLISDAEGERKQVTGITWDSRKVSAGDAFLAMPGEHVDGNDYLHAAIAQGAAMIICTRKPDGNTLAVAGEFACPVAVVQDGIKALERLASFWRERLRCVVVGVTGSTGKTSTKDMLYGVLSQRYNTVATQGNNNNEIGIPYTVLRANPDTEVLIVEMGMRGLGQISAGCAIARPSIGVVTNVGVCHMELLGSREAIAQAKGEMLACLPATGLAVVNADDDMTDYLLQSANVEEHATRVVGFGRSQGASTKVDNVAVGDDGCASFDLAIGNADAVRVELGVPGEHNVTNALAAAVVGNYLGVSLQDIAEGLAGVAPSGMRMEITQAPGGFTIINDAYNANPDSMAAALATLSSMSCAGKRIAVLGDMGELGQSEAQLHEQVGAAVAASKVDVLICVGQLASHIAAGAKAADASCDIHCAQDVASAVLTLRRIVAASDVVLLKASRFMGFEQIVEEISR